MLAKDFAFAWRTLRRSPAFALTAVATIALGIGASTAIFSVTHAVLLRPLPYRNPDRLVLACGDMRKRNVKDFPFSNADFFDLRNSARSTFEEFTAVVTGRGLLPREDGTTEEIGVGRVTPNFFRMMGAKIAFGRDFVEADGLPQPPLPPPGGAPAGAAAPPPLPVFAILSYEFFQRRYGGNPAIIGHPLRRVAGPLVVGVLAPGFELLFPPDADMERTPDVWTALRLAYDAAERNNVSLRVIGRLKQGVALRQAQAEADAFSAEEQRQDTIERTADWHVRLEPMQQHLVAQVRPAILALMGAAIFLLLISCANVANLLLVRTSLRARELAVRTALGGSWWRLARQLLSEALVLAGIGSLVGAGLAWLGIHQLRVIAPANLPRLDSIAIDPAVLAFTAMAGLAAAAIFGMAPAVNAAQPDVMHVLRASGRTAGLGGGGLLRNGVVVAEVALAFVLLIGSGLMFRSFLALQRIDPGFDARGLLTFQLQGGGGQNPQQRAAFTRQVHDRLAALPGVQSVTASFPFPLTGNFSPIRWGLEPALADPSKFQAVDFQLVLPGYFDTLRTPILAGRSFTDADNAPERKLVIIDQFLAGKAFPRESPIGKRILVRLATPEPEWVEVIGVAAHQRQSSLAEPGREQVYFTDGFIGHGAARRWAVRTAGSPAQYAGQVRAEIAKIGRQLLLTEMQPMQTYVEQAQAGTRFSLLLIGVFAVMAALLAGVGLYGVLSTLVRQRTAEIGVRMALGAAPGSIFQLVVGQGLRLSAGGIVLGLAAAFVLTRVMTSMLVGVKATDPPTFAAVAALFFAIAALACWLPARRAAGLDPTQALREE